MSENGSEARYQKARALLEAAHNDAAMMDAAIEKMLKEGTAMRFDSAEALMEWLKKSDETI
jgi:hypothetical protein